MRKTNIAVAEKLAAVFHTKLYGFTFDLSRSSASALLTCFPPNCTRLDDTRATQSQPFFSPPKKRRFDELPATNGENRHFENDSLAFALRSAYLRVHINSEDEHFKTHGCVLFAFCL